MFSPYRWTVGTKKNFWKTCSQKSHCQKNCDSTDLRQGSEQSYSCMKCASEISNSIPTVYYVSSSVQDKSRP